MEARPTPRTAAAGSPLHPDMDVLIGYHHRRLDEQAADAVERHLARCRYCAMLRLDLESFSVAGDHALPPRESAAARLLTRSVLQQLRAESWRNRAMAVSLLIALVLPVGIYSRVQAERAGLGMPEVNLPILSLKPRPSLRGDEEARLRLAPGNRFFTLLLNLVEAPAFPEYSLTVVDHAGREVLSLSRLLLSPLGTFNLGLPASAFKPGRYRLLLFGVAGPKREPVAEYSLEIAPAPRPREAPSRNGMRI